MCRSCELGHCLGLRPFRSLHDLELYTVAFIQRAEPTAIDGRVMDKYVGAIVLGNKPVALLIVEPFNCTSCHVGHPPDMDERCAALAARRRLKTALASVYRYAVPFNLTEIMHTAVALKATAQPTSFCGASQELTAKICRMQVKKGLSPDRKYARLTDKVLPHRVPAQIPENDPRATIAYAGYAKWWNFAGMDAGLR